MGPEHKAAIHTDNIALVTSWIRDDDSHSIAENEAQKSSAGADSVDLPSCVELSAELSYTFIHLLRVLHRVQ